MGVDIFSVVYCLFLFFFFFKQKTAYEMRISDWSSDVCSSDLSGLAARRARHRPRNRRLRGSLEVVGQRTGEILGNELGLLRCVGERAVLMRARSPADAGREVVRDFPRTLRRAFVVPWSGRACRSGLHASVRDPAASPDAPN